MQKEGKGANHVRESHDGSLNLFFDYNEANMWVNNNT